MGQRKGQRTNAGSEHDRKKMEVRKRENIKEIGHRKKKVQGKDTKNARGGTEKKIFRGTENQK